MSIYVRLSGAGPPMSIAKEHVASTKEHAGHQHAGGHLFQRIPRNLFLPFLQPQQYREGKRVVKCDTAFARNRRLLRFRVSIGQRYARTAYHAEHRWD